MKHTVTVFRGDGIGPELVDNVLKILEAAKAPLEYEIYNVGEDEWKRNGALIPDEAYASFERTKVLLKSPITTPVGKGFRSLNVTLRGKYDLYANIRPVKSNDAVKTPFKNVDIVIFRENTEGLYVGKEEQIDENTVHAIKIVTKIKELRELTEYDLFVCIRGIHYIRSDFIELVRSFGILELQRTGTICMSKD